MRFHGTLTDPDFAPWFKVYKRRVLEIYRSGVRWYDRWETSDLFLVQMRICNEDVYVSVYGVGSAYFEFQTSGLPVVTDGGATPIYLANVIGVTVNGLTGLSVQAELMGGKKSEDAASLSLIRRPAQVQLLDEPVHYPGPKGPQISYPRALYKCHSPKHSHTGIYLRCYHCAVLPFYEFIPQASINAHQARDIGYDIPWMDGLGRGDVRSAYLNGVTDDWPRASGIRKITHPTYGQREFAIYVDAFDQVNVFPTDQIGPLAGSFFSPAQNVDASMVQMQRVPFPAWVYNKAQTYKSWVASPTDPSDPFGTLNLPDIHWELHPDGTKMCAVVHERVQASLDTTYFAPYATDTGSLGPGTYYPDATSFAFMNLFAMGVPPQIRGVLNSTSTNTWYHVAPGLLEVAIDIEITGPGAQDFTVSLSVNEIRRPTTSPYCPFVAGYVWHTIKDTPAEDSTVATLATRGDLCVLDTEVYGDPLNGYTGELYSLKNTTTGEEIATFGAASTYISAAAAVGSPLTDQSLLVSYCMQTLSFVTKDQLLIHQDVGVAADFSTIVSEVTHFGLTVRVMGKYQKTFFPSNMDPAIADIITFAAQQPDARALLLAEYPGLQFMPLNDLRGWGNTDLDSLRESYARDFSHDTYTPPINPLQNWAEIETAGHKFYKTGIRTTPLPTATANTWYNNLMIAGHGLRPFPMFDVTEPRPGWYLYAGQVINKIFLTSHTTFFTHPNGTWALFDQSFIYNPSPMKSENFNAMGKLVGSTIADLDVTKLEHCIFDQVHFSLPTMNGFSTLDTSFLKLYNQAVRKAQREQTMNPADNSTLMAVDYSDMRATFKVNTVLDTVDPTVSYAQLQLNWYQGYTGYLLETGYFNGGKDFGVGFESRPSGAISDSHMGSYFDNGSGSLQDPFLANGQQVTFSSCVMITP